MAKKSRRNRGRQQTKAGKTVRSQQPRASAGVERPASGQAVPETVDAAPRETPVQAPPATRTARRMQDLGSRHEHVIPEMKRIGIIAACMMLVIVVLAIVLG